ncbi:hypothetical protein L7F22_062733 [Adiantum nelumboides]|nr:hypothetical protein [Adiantum nelumboides]
MLAATSLDAAKTTSTTTAPSVAVKEEEDAVVFPKNLCGYQSKTFTGPCLSNKSCIYKCKAVEHAYTGACHLAHVNTRCYCYVNC